MKAEAKNLIIAAVVVVIIIVIAASVAFAVVITGVLTTIGPGDTIRLKYVPTGAYLDLSGDVPTLSKAGSVLAIASTAAPAGAVRTGGRVTLSAASATKFAVVRGSGGCTLGTAAAATTHWDLRNTRALGRTGDTLAAGPTYAVRPHDSEGSCKAGCALARVDGEWGFQCADQSGCGWKIVKV